MAFNEVPNRTTAFKTKERPWLKMQVEGQPLLHMCDGRGGMAGRCWQFRVTMTMARCG